jgi:hypothetical protein
MCGLYRTGTGYGTYYTRLYEDDNGVATASERGVMNLNYVWNNTVHVRSTGDAAELFAGPT